MQPPRDAVMVAEPLPATGLVIERLVLCTRHCANGIRSRLSPIHSCVGCRTGAERAADLGAARGQRRGAAGAALGSLGPIVIALCEIHCLTTFRPIVGCRGLGRVLEVAGVDILQRRLEGHTVAQAQAEVGRAQVGRTRGMWGWGADRGCRQRERVARTTHAAARPGRRRGQGCARLVLVPDRRGRLGVADVVAC